MGGGGGLGGGMRRETQGMSEASYFTYAPVEDIRHFTVQNRVDFTISLPEVMFEISNITARCCKFLAPKWPSLSLVPLNGPKKSRAPLKFSILCLDHMESWKWRHSVIFKG